MPLDPQVARFLREMETNDSKPQQPLSLAAQRHIAAQAAIAQAGKPEQVASIEDREIIGPQGSIPLKIYTPDMPGHGPHPVLVYFHPGGWVFGSLEGCDPVCRALANHASCLVVSVGYRLAPEHRFPAAPEDCYAATRWVAEHAHIINADSRRIAIGGDSAGGNLAAAVALMAKDRGGPELCYQILIYPETDYYEPGTPSYTTYATGYDLTREAMIWFWDQYLVSKEDGKHPYAAPLQASDLRNLPPALIITAEYDPVRDEAEYYARRLQQAGTTVHLSRYEGMIHSFFRMFALFDQSTQALEEVSTRLKDIFALTRNKVE